VFVPEGLLQLGGMTHLIGASFVALVRPPYSWRGEFVNQSYVLVRRCFVPALFSCFFFGLAIAFPAGQLVSLLGTVDRLGAFYVNAAVREFGPWITGMVVAGIGGTAVTADLGARKVRDEIAALESLGVDPIKALVAPRFLALGVVTAAMTMVGIFMGIVSGAVGTLLLGSPLASYTSTFGSNFTVYDLAGSLLKVTLFGVIVAATSCYKGMSVKGGPAGVGRAVNQAVVLAFAAIWIADYAYGSLLLAAFPQTQTLR
jgi:phospholipid/cholesterol/gamma-HCH transport system permease protein